ncbi:unnamed protein product [Penicillium nalgiovense]|nr:unnamed protein product [Penicillium nalgiovense]
MDGGHDRFSPKHLKGRNCPHGSKEVQYPRHRRSQWTYRQNWYRYFRSPSQGIHRLTNLFHKGNESANNFRRVVGLFIHGNRSHTSQVLQTPIGQSTGPIATEAVTSVGTSLGSLRASTLSLSVIRAENQDLPPLNVEKRAAESLTLPRKRRRHLYSTS